MQYMPLFVNMLNRKVLIVGGGSVALRKARRLVEAGAKVTVIAPAVKEEFSSLAGVVIQARKALPEDISDEYFAVIFASNDKEINESLSKICKRKHIMVDRCDESQKSDFITGSVATCGSIINSTVSGGIPTLSKLINNRVKKLFTPELKQLNELLRELRPIILASNKQNKIYINSLINEEILDRIKIEGTNPLKQEILACL